MPHNTPSDDNSDLPCDEDIQTHIQTLKTQHRQIDKEILALMTIGAADMLKIRRMKKLKLSLKDKIAFLENQITPDIIA